MIKSLLILFSVFQLAAPSSCNKSGGRQQQSIPGLWKGTFTVEDGSTGTFYFSIKPGGDILIENYHNGVLRIGKGKWEYAENVFTCTTEYFYGHPSNIGTVTWHRAFLNGRDEMNSGTWKNQTPNDDTGEFTLQKIK